MTNNVIILDFFSLKITIHSKKNKQFVRLKFNFKVENMVTRILKQDWAIHAVNGISFNLKKGELLGVVWESGSGESVTVLSLIKFLPIPPAEIVSGLTEFEEHGLIKLDSNHWNLKTVL